MSWRADSYLDGTRVASIPVDTQEEAEAEAFNGSAKFGVANIVESVGGGESSKATLTRKIHATQDVPYAFVNPLVAAQVLVPTSPDLFRVVSPDGRSFDADVAEVTLSLESYLAKGFTVVDGKVVPPKAVV